MKSLAGFLIILIVGGCAGFYMTIQPQELTYLSKEQSDSLIYSTRYDVMAQTRNRKYAKKEYKKGVKIIAIKLENHTGRDINFRNDIRIYMGDRLILPVEPTVTYNLLRQPSALYLLWGLLYFNYIDCENNDCIVIPIPIGLLIGLSNVGFASSANQDFRKELLENNILDKVIKDGETAYGLLSLSSDIVAPIKLKVLPAN